MQSYDEVFVTGCDEACEWQLKWFLENFFKYHIQIPIVFADFGVSREMREWLHVVSNVDQIFDVPMQKNRGWFLKPKTLKLIPARKVCWLDTDCEILGNIDDIFSYTQPEKIAMAKDRPWSERSGEEWHNSGVMVIEGKPMILDKWIKYCSQRAVQGDQETLHVLLKTPIDRIKYIETIPSKYNWLRIDLIDGKDSKDKKVMHWTGIKGNYEIQRKIYNAQ